MPRAISEIGSASIAAPRAADRSQTCSCCRCRRQRALEALIEGGLVEGEVGPATGSVTGDEMLQSIVDTKQAPFRYICQIQVTHANGSKGVGTGALIGARTVLTAAHVLADRTGEFVKPHLVRIAPGMDLHPLFGTSHATELIIRRHFVPGKPRDPRNPLMLKLFRERGEATRFDIAIVKIERPLGVEVGFWGGAPPPIDTRGSALGAIRSWRPGHFKVNACGYPASKKGTTQWSAYVDTVRLQDGLLHLKTNSLEEGHSGCPVWVTRSRSNGGRLLFAVYVGTRPRNQHVGAYLDEGLLKFINGHRVGAPSVEVERDSRRVR